MIEALLTARNGHNITDDLDDSSYVLMAGGVDPDEEMAIRAIIDKAEVTLRMKKPILVAHNALADLCFLYNTFIEPLPAVLEHFRVDVANIFGKLVDTKYLATRGQHDMMPDKNLTELYEEIKDCGGPLIYPEFVAQRGYGQRALAHEAGYDSKSISASLHRQYVTNFSPFNRLHDGGGLHKAMLRSGRQAAPSEEHPA